MSTIWSEKADDILSIGILMPEGIQNWALTSIQAIVAAKELCLVGIPVLGGDVCTVQNGRIFPNSDNWYCNRQNEESEADYLKRCLEVTVDYIKAYPTLDGEDVYFNLVPDCNDFSKSFL